MEIVSFGQRKISEMEKLTWELYQKIVIDDLAVSGIETRTPLIIRLAAVDDISIVDIWLSVIWLPMRTSRLKRQYTTTKISQYLQKSGISPITRSGGGIFSQICVSE